MKDWDKFYCSQFDCVYYDSESEFCNYCVKNLPHKLKSGNK